jgi:hypothetical protein
VEGIVYYLPKIVSSVFTALWYTTANMSGYVVPQLRSSLLRLQGNTMSADIKLVPAQN